MTKDEIDELDRLHGEATAGPWTFTLDDDGRAATRQWREVHAGRNCIVAPDWYERRAGGETETVSGVRLSEANAASMVALHNAAPALIEAAREVERLRAFVPRWRETTPADVRSFRVYGLWVGTSSVNDGTILVRPDGSAYEGAGVRHPDIETAARAVCDRLGIPYVPVETT